MLFGLVTLKREWFQSQTAIGRFRNFAIATLAVWPLAVFFQYRPFYLAKLQASMFASVALWLLALVGAVSLIGLVFGMAWYYWRVDTSPIWAKVVWFLMALVLSPFVEVAYYLFVYRRQVLRARNSAQTAA